MGGWRGSSARDSVQVAEDWFAGATDVRFIACDPHIIRPDLNSARIRRRRRVRQYANCGTRRARPLAFPEPDEIILANNSTD